MNFFIFNCRNFDNTKISTSIDESNLCAILTKYLTTIPKQKKAAQPVSHSTNMNYFIRSQRHFLFCVLADQGFLKDLLHRLGPTHPAKYLNLPCKCCTCSEASMATFVMSRLSIFSHYNKNTRIKCVCDDTFCYWYPVVA